MSSQPTLVQLWQWTFQFGDLVNAALLLITVISLLITLRQIVRGNKAQQALVFKESYLGAFAQPAMLEALSIIELDRFRATEAHGAVDKAQEISVNMLLGYATGVCAMRELGQMSKKELRKFSYFLLVLYHNLDVRIYCRFLHDWESKETGGIHLRPYASWVDYCKRAFKLPDIYSAEQKAIDHQAKQAQLERERPREDSTESSTPNNPTLGEDVT